MSASNEWFEYHLTPNGWVEGAEKVDGGGLKSKPSPPERVLTLCFHERLSSPFSKMEYWYTEGWRHEDSNLVQELINKYGSKPPDYGDRYTLR